MPEGEAAPTLALSLRGDVSIVEGPDGRRLSLPCGSVLVPASLDPVLRALAAGGASADELVALAGSVAGTGAGLQTLLTLTRLARLGLIRQTLVHGSVALVSLDSASSADPAALPRPDPATRHRLSRFAYLRQEHGQLVLESPHAPGRLTVHDPRAMLIVHQLCRPHALSELSGAEARLPGAVVASIVGLLLAAGTLDSDQERALEQWDFHDLLFHARSRRGRHDYPYGGNHRFRGKVQPLPALKPAGGGERMALARPDVTALMERDVPFTRVLEARRSRRESGDPALGAAELGAFLYRAARVRELTPLRPDENQLSDRPYPSGGASYELELYPVVNRSRDLAPGLYHYCPASHELEKLRGRTAEVDGLIEAAFQSAGARATPQVLIVLAARFARVSWKYDSMAYALVLKHVGVLYQTMYLVATAMGLAPCALGGGNSDLFAAAAGSDYYSETSVGEFLLATPS
jgi:SagB-type dehydrogenase family enzyme